MLPQNFCKISLKIFEKPLYFWEKEEYDWAVR